MSGKSVRYIQHFRQQWRFCIVICSISVWLASRLANSYAICVVYAALPASLVSLYWFLQYTLGVLPNRGAKPTAPQSVWYMQHFRHQSSFCIFFTIHLEGAQSEGTICVVYATLSVSVLILYWFFTIHLGVPQNRGRKSIY